MKILFCNPPRVTDNGDGTETYAIVAGSRWPHKITRPIGQKIDYSPFPLYMAYGAAMCRQAGHSVFVRDSIALDEKEWEFQAYVKCVNPDVLFFEPATPTIDIDIRICRELKAALPFLKIVAGGIHASGLHDETIKLAGDAIDCYITGEYEQAITDYCGLVEKTLETPNFMNVSFDFKSAPWPARDLFPTNNTPDFNCYHDGFISLKPSATMHGSRGCITHCDFCTEIALMEKRFNTRTTADMCDEIEALVLRGVKEVYFDDSIFTGSKKHVMAFADEMIRRGLHKRVSWSAMCAFMGGTDEEMLTRMAKSGCIGVKFGLDSSSPEVLKEINKPLKPEKVRELCKVCNRLGIKCHGTLATGHFADSEATVAATLEFAKSITCDTMQFSTVTPYPGTPLFEKLKAAGRLRTTDWREFDGLGSSVMLWDNGLTSERLKEMIDQGGKDWLRTMMRSPAWWLRQWRLFLRSAPSQGWPLIKRRIEQVVAATGLNNDWPEIKINLWAIGTCIIFAAIIIWIVL